MPVDLVIDHSVIVDDFGTPKAFARNVELEYERNGERYNFLKWGQGAFENFRVVPPGTGICHQVNLEYLAQTVWTNAFADGRTVAYPDTLVGTDSHTTMVNGLAVLGWGVGGIEAEAAMLGQPQSMLIPEVIGFKLTGKLNEGVTATDLVLTVTQMLRKKGVVNKFVEFFGPGLDELTLADRATIANMAPEYGATCGFFPVDKETLNYLTISGREEGRIALVEAYCKAQGLYREANSPDPVFTDTLELDLGAVEPSMAGPKRPEGRVALSAVGSGFATALEAEYKKPGEGQETRCRRGQILRHRPWRRRHRRDHELHQHLEPERADRGRAAGAQCPCQGPDVEAVGQDLAGARDRRSSPPISINPACRRRSMRSASTSSASAAPPASAIRGRFRRRFPKPSTTTASSPRRSSRATATSRAASARTCRRTISPPRRSSSPMQSPAR